MDTLTKESLGQYKARDDTMLSFRKWPGPDDVIVYLHGIESHSGWYAAFASALNEKGFTVYGIDRRGSGINEDGEKGDAADYTIFLDDVEEALRFIRSQHLGRKVYLMGICWGGLLAVDYCASRQTLPDGIILLSPAIYRKVDLNIFVKAAAATCSLVAPMMRFAIPIKDPMFTSNKGYLDFIRNDRLRLRSLTCRFFGQILRMEKEFAQFNTRIFLPALVLLAGNDEIVDNIKVAEWFTRLGSGDKTVNVLGGFSHVMPFEDKAHLLIDHITKWAGRRKQTLEGQHITH